MVVAVVLFISSLLSVKPCGRMATLSSGSHPDAAIGGMHVFGISWSWRAMRLEAGKKNRNHATSGAASLGPNADLRSTPRGG
ncbi:hypothetical protein [Luteibacter aegosomatissinici]|uniref:hypothetical protein n=1 Tax=Luteibacter aegosomatissinici TaxID=2911539 RepID=UPI001FF731A5|nr:hypothetical protein [Luteibacter aegosomatissinici]UPG92858.1 hypothetical protein L2Y97_13385 [Luteibacter aegosomatissinici]